MDLSGIGGTQPPLTSSQFEQKVTELYDGDTVEECIGEAVDDVWPVGLLDGEPVNRATVEQELEPSYREHQREAVVELIEKLYVDDKDVVTLSAPTGAGKSLILYAVVEVLNVVARRKSFATTPLNALVDQMDTDEYLSEVITIKGKNNYDCVHHQDRGTSVDKAVCQRVTDFECQYKDQHHENGGCPYYGRKHAALMHPEVVTNLSYLMANSMIPDVVDSKFDPRELIEIDECQGIEDFGLQFIGFSVSKRSVPLVWEQIDRPPHGENVDDLADWIRDEVVEVVGAKIDEFEELHELTEEQTTKKEKLEQFYRRAQNFLMDYEEHHWVAEKDTVADTWAVKFQPIFIGRFLGSYLWAQGNKTILSSATIPPNIMEEVGLSDRRTGHVEVPSTFPPERRPVYTDTEVGKMTYSQRDQTIPKLANRLADIANHHSDHKGFVHCHAYSIAERIYNELPMDVQQRTRLQDGDDREESLDRWCEAPVDETGYTEEEGGQIFLSVAMDEGISLDNDLARWQVIAKAAYPNMSDKRVDYRMDEDTMDGTDWTWYSSKAAINLQQAVGRGMRSKDDWCHSYVLDKSAADLIERNDYLFEDWFLDAVDVEPSSEIPSRYR